MKGLVNQTTWGHTPLHLAARFNATEAIKTIHSLSTKQDFDRWKELREQRDHLERTPLFIAAQFGRTEAASCLLELGADPTVTDKDKVMCLTFMVEKMEDVALVALQSEFYYKKDTIKREEEFFLTALEPFRDDRDVKGKMHTPLDAIINSKRLKLIRCPVIEEIIVTKWQLFGKFYTGVKLVVDFLYALLFAILGCIDRWSVRPLYDRPEDVWKAVCYILCGLLTLIFMSLETIHLVYSRKAFIAWKSRRLQKINAEKGKCHEKWKNVDEQFLKKEEEYLNNLPSPYRGDVWNFMDWVVYIIVLATLITHSVDIDITRRSHIPPCCPMDASLPCNDSSADVCLDGKVNERSLSLWNNRIFAITVILLFIRLLKHIRIFRFFGSFIALLYSIAVDVFRFFLLYVAFYVPYVCAFWMVFGATNTIPDMTTLDRVFFTLYRMTLVDEYPYNEMLDFDIVMGYILIGTFLAVSAILFINLFIALLSDSFQRVYDDAIANAIMEQAKLVVTLEDEILGLRERAMTKYREKFKKLYVPHIKPFKYYLLNTSTSEERIMKRIDDLEDFLKQSLETMEKQTKNVPSGPARLIPVLPAAAELDAVSHRTHQDLLRISAVLNEVSLRLDKTTRGLLNLR